jgi:prophage regulatory protein
MITNLNQPKMFISIKDVARKIALSPSSIRRLTLAGKFPKPINLSKHRVVWLEADVEEWMSKKYYGERAANDNS